jgi:hypothetical protein
MRSIRSLEPSIPVKDRLGMRLGLLFVGTFLGLAAVLMAWTMFATISDRRASAAELGTAAPAIVIDPKIQTDLAKAMAFDALAGDAEVLNPFIDRAGISKTVVPTASNAGQTTGSSSTTTTTPAATGTVSSSGGGGLQTLGSQTGSSSFVPVASSAKERYDDWLERQKKGESVVPEAEILGVDDLVPVGFASGGDRGAEVMLHSLALCRTFSFPAGTRLYDGWVNGFDQNEVVFTFLNGIRRKSYADVEPCRSNESVATLNN